MDKLASGYQIEQYNTDQYSYHLEEGTMTVDNDLQTSNQALGALVSQYGLPERQININKYANPGE